MKSMTVVLLFGAVLLSSCSKKRGCTDPAAINFDVHAGIDDGSCVYPVQSKANVTINFTFNFDGVPVTAGNFNQFNYITEDGDTLSIARLRYLISDFSIYKSGGDSIRLDDYHLVDMSEQSSLSFIANEIDLGAYSAVGFTWGFDAIDNHGNYPDLNTASWNWPEMIGGGYHFMQFDGHFMNGGTPSPFNYHNGTASRDGVHEANHAYIRLAGVDINETHVLMEISMDIAEWFKNPHTWDLNVFSIRLMPNYTAQKLMHDQVYSVFSLGSISQGP
jgi:hypothetical protein